MILFTKNLRQDRKESEQKELEQRGSATNRKFIFLQGGSTKSVEYCVNVGEILCAISFPAQTAIWFRNESMLLVKPECFSEIKNALGSKGVSGKAERTYYSGSFEIIVNSENVSFVGNDGSFSELQYDPSGYTRITEFGYKDFLKAIGIDKN